MLGLNLIHNTSAALIKNGTVLAAAEEERFNRLKHTSAFPKKSIEYCLKHAGLELGDIDHIATSFEFEKFANSKNPFEQNVIAHDDATAVGKKRILADNRLIYLKIIRDLEKNNLLETVSVPHHFAHASGSYYLSGFKNSSILVLDGRGENESTSLMNGEDGRISVVENYPIKNSLGHLYTYVTYLCGLYSNIGQEGKTMGLSAFGIPRIDFSKVLLLDKGKYRVNKAHMRALGKYKTSLGNITDNSRNLAYGVQRSFEKALVLLANGLVKKTGNPDISLSGGGALNCRANQELRSCDFVKQVYVQPPANDAGTALGAALYTYSEIKGLKPSKQEDVFLGPSYTSNEIEEVLEIAKIEFEKINDSSKCAAELLSKGKIIGWFQGRMEFGSRSLGNRSILADPKDSCMKDKINHFVKHREAWRPFAPSIIYECMDDYFECKCSAPHMTISFNALKDKIKDISSVVHVDGTARVQTVETGRNGKFYELLNEFYGITGIPILLNTSFNDCGEPIVCTPQDALQCFFSTGLDALVLGDYLVIK